MPSVPKGFKGSAGGVFGFQVKNTNAVINAIANYGSKSNTKLRAGFKSALIMLEAESIRLVRGNVYWKNPIDHNRMVGTITNKLDKFTFTAIEGRYGTNVDYAIYVHEGTKLMKIGAQRSGKAHGEDGKRPFLTDALANKKAEIIKMIIDAYKLEIYK